MSQKYVLTEYGDWTDDFRQFSKDHDLDADAGEDKADALIEAWRSGKFKLGPKEHDTRKHRLVLWIKWLKNNL